jgi:hypothetical protein
MAKRQWVRVAAVFAALVPIALSATAVEAQVPLANGGVGVINTPETVSNSGLDDFGGFPSALTGTACISGLDGGCETSSGSVTPGLMVSASGSTTGGVDTAVAGSQSQMTYYYEVNGPSYQAELDFSGVVTTTAGGANATGDAGIGGSYAPNLEACSSSGPALCPSGEKSSASASGVAYYVPTGSVEDLVLTAYGGSSEGAGIYSASADPMITLDPTFLADNPGETFTLVFSSDINPNGVPEPSPGRCCCSASPASALLAIAHRARAPPSPPDLDGKNLRAPKQAASFMKRQTLVGGAAVTLYLEGYYFGPGTACRSATYLNCPFGGIVKPSGSALVIPDISTDDTLLVGVDITRKAGSGASITDPGMLTLSVPAGVDIISAGGATYAPGAAPEPST